MNLGTLLTMIYGNKQVTYLIALIAANLILGIVASLKAGDFRLHSVADWLGQRVLPMLSGYGAAALVAWANPDLAYLQTGAFFTLTAALLGYILSNLKDLGFTVVPDAVASNSVTARVNTALKRHPSVVAPVATPPVVSK